jgi:hypothetical protein
MVARLIRFEGAAQGVERQQARAYQDLLPALEQMEGFRGLIFLGAPSEKRPLRSDCGQMTKPLTRAPTRRAPCARERPKQASRSSRSSGTK